MSNKKIPLVSLITINYNTAEHTIHLLRSIQKLSYENLEIIVVDNGSNEDPKDVFLNEFPEIIYVRSDENLGFAGGNNIGITKASGEFIFFINNDTELEDEIIPRLIDRFFSDPTIGLISPKILYYKTKIIQFAGYTPLSIVARNRAIGNKTTDNGEFNRLVDSPYGHGAALMVKKEVINEVGKMPEIYFLYYEELDWCEMIRRKGYKIKVDQTVTIGHKESMSVGKLSSIKSYYLIRNRILFVRRNFTFWRRLFFIFYICLISFPKTLLSHLYAKQYDHAKAVCRGLFWNLNHTAS